MTVGARAHSRGRLGAVPENAPALDGLPIQEVAAFRTALRRFERRTELAVKEAGLTPRRYLLLLLVAARPKDDPATVSSLSNDMEMPQSTVTDLVARAVEGGLLERREASADGRVTHLSVTELGGERLAVAMERLASERVELRRRLSDLTRMI